MPQPISGESPTRPGSWPARPPVDVPATMVPKRSMATAPTVPGWSASSRCRCRSVTSSRGIAERDAEGARLVDRPRADEEGVAPVVEDAPGEGDRVPDLGDAGHGAVAERVALHDGRVHLDGARGREDGAAPGIEARVILEDAHRRFHRVERAATAAEDLPAGFDGARDALAELFGLLGRVRPRAAVDDECGHAACHPLHLALTMTP